MFLQIALCPIKPDFLSLKKMKSCLKPLDSYHANKEFSGSNFQSGKGRENALGSLYKQNKTLKKGSKGLTNNMSSPWRLILTFLSLKRNIKRAESATTIMIQSFDNYTFASQKKAKKFCDSSKEAGNESQGHWHWWWQIKLWADSKYIQSPPSPKCTILAFKTDLHSLHASSLSIQGHLFQWETGSAVFWVRKL